LRRPPVSLVQPGSAGVLPACFFRLEANLVGAPVPNVFSLLRLLAGAERAGSMARRQRRGNANTANSGAARCSESSASDRCPRKLKACRTVAGVRAQRHPRSDSKISNRPRMGSQNSGIPPGCTDPPDCSTGSLRSAATPGYSLPTLRVEKKKAVRLDP